MITVSITTALRPGNPTLERTVTSLWRAGFNLPLIFAEPGAPAAGWLDSLVIRREERYGEWRNWLHALDETIRRSPWAIAYLTIEDDVVFCRHVREQLELEMWPSERCGLLQVYTGYRHGRRLPRGLVRLPDQFVSGMNAACALLFRPAAARDVVQYGLTRGWSGKRLPAKEPCEIKETDIFIGTAMADLGYEIWCHVPSLAFHIGDESASHDAKMAARGNRQAFEFPGEEADARAVR